MSKEEFLELEGTVVDAVKGKFRVEIDPPVQKDPAMKAPTFIVLAHLAGKMRMNQIKIVVGDRVKVEVSTYDLSQGRITYRLK